MGRTDLEGRGGLFSVVLRSDTADDEEDAKDEEDEELGRDVGLHCFECLVEGRQISDKLSQRSSWVVRQRVDPKKVAWQFGDSGRAGDIRGAEYYKTFIIHHSIQSNSGFQFLQSIVLLLVV